LVVFGWEEGGEEEEEEEESAKRVAGDVAPRNICLTALYDAR